MDTLTIGNEEYAVVPKQAFVDMQHALENLEDEQAVLQARADIENGDDELLPSDFVEKLLLSGINKIKLWREYRGLNVTQFAQKTNINIATVSRIENDKREPTLSQVKTIANVLDVDVDDLI